MAAEADTAAETWQTLFGSPTADNSAVPGASSPAPGAPPGAPSDQPNDDVFGPPGAPPHPILRPDGTVLPQDGTAAPQGAADATATTTSSKAPTGHYWDAELTPPAGASAGLKAFISMAEEAIQTAVDLLGRGTPELPPKVDDLLRPVIYESIGDSLMKTQYEEALAEVQSRQTALLTYDTKVIKTSIVVAAGSDETLRAIKAIVAELQAKLNAAGSGKLKPAQEVALMKLVAVAVDLVYDKVTAVYQLNNDMAGDGNDDSGSSGSSSGGQTGSSGSGDGAGGLGQLLPMLAMLPMMAMPLVQQLPELLKQQDKGEDQPGAAGQPAEGQPPAAAPGAAPQGTTTPAPAAPGTTGQPAAPAATASTNSPGSATPVANTSPVSARANVRRAVQRSEGTPTDTEAANQGDLDDDEVIDVDSPVVQA